MNSDPRIILDEILHHMGQEHLLAYAQDDRDILALKKDIQILDLQLFLRLQQQIDVEDQKHETYVPPKPAVAVDQDVDLTKFGCLILAGGQASRLRLSGPKGCIPITPYAQKSLFQLHAEKIKAASALIGQPIPVAIMVSSALRAETEIFFQEHGYFGLQTSQVSFFSQTLWPLLNFDGNLLLSSPGRLAMGPNGNGDVFKQFVQCGIWKKWQEKGIEHVRVFPIDNPLALPVDQKLFATHVADHNDITLQAIRKEKGEKTGTLSLIDGKLGVLEYGEFEGEGEYANIGLYVFSMDFVKRASNFELPLHKVKKAVKTLDGEVPKEPNVWKFETFIFDAFSEAHKSEFLVYPKESCFAPLKNFEGEGSIATVQAALLSRERKLWASITGNEPPKDAKFELGASFYYPTASQLVEWKNKPFPNKNIIEDL